MMRSAIVFKPSTLLRLHRALVQRKYRELFSPKAKKKPGPKGPTKELINAIIEMKSRNKTWGCPRIADQIRLAFGVVITKDVVRRVLAKHYRPSPNADGPSWLSFLGHSKDSLWSVDLFRCESIVVKTYWVMVVMDQFTRRIVGFGVCAGSVDGLTLCRMFNRATSGLGPPKRLSSDNDPLYRSHRWRANLRVLEIEEIKSVPYVPLSHPFIERLIGTLRRECLDQTLFWNATDLERKLTEFKEYFNESRAHSGIGSATPAFKAGKPSGNVANLDRHRWQTHCRGLYQTPIAA